jgi:hypothetical protein
MSENKLVILYILLWNIGLILLSAFCCWFFNTLWGLLPLFWAKSVDYIKETNDNKETNEN